tara:strand:- start:343 stop:1083 length:741 start_codon:yes stop_codon:yes gene_type:complete
MPPPLPRLPLLALRVGGKGRAADVLAQWAEEARPRVGVRFGNWANLRGRAKHRLLHDVAQLADEQSDGGYVGVYEQLHIDALLGQHRYSVEHVVPRSHVNGRLPGAAENDPRGWVEASRRSNQRRSNLPLVMWEAEGLEPNTTIRVGDKLHYVPPSEQRARLARKWLFIRATYDGIDAPSAAQAARKANVVLLAATDLAGPAELAVDRLYRERLGAGNPLLGPNSTRYYESEEFVEHAFRNSRGRA